MPTEATIDEDRHLLPVAADAPELGLSDAKDEQPAGAVAAVAGARPPLGLAGAKLQIGQGTL